MINTLIIDGRILEDPLIIPDPLQEEISVRIDIEHQSMTGKTVITVIVRDDKARTAARIFKKDDIVRVVGSLVGMKRNGRWLYLVEANDLEKTG